MGNVLLLTMKHLLCNCLESHLLHYTQKSIWCWETCVTAESSHTQPVSVHQPGASGVKSRGAGAQLSERESPHHFIGCFSNAQRTNLRRDRNTVRYWKEIKSFAGISSPFEYTVSESAGCHPAVGLYVMTFKHLADRSQSFSQLDRQD